MKNQKRQKQKEYFFYAIIAGVTSIYIEIIAIGTYMYEQECVVDFLCGNINCGIHRFHTNIA